MIAFGNKIQYSKIFVLISLLLDIPYIYNYALAFARNLFANSKRWNFRAII